MFPHLCFMFGSCCVCFVFLLWRGGKLCEVLRFDFMDRMACMALSRPRKLTMRRDMCYLHQL